MAESGLSPNEDRIRYWTFNDSSGIASMSEYRTRSTLRIAAMLALLAVVAMALLFLRLPSAGSVYHYRSDQYALQGNTALVLRNRGCLVLSRSEADIGIAEAAPGSENRLFVIAGTNRIRSGRDKLGLYLVDSETGLIARPGDAIDAEIQFRGKIGALEDMFRAGWRLDDRCASRLAVVFSIARVHR